MAYKKQNWQSNELLTSEKLNHMEDGIATANTIVTQSTAGLMAVEDKIKLDGIAAGAAVTSVNNQTGAVSVTPANINAVDKFGDTMVGPLTLNSDYEGARAIHFYVNETETGWLTTKDQTNAMQFVQQNPNVAGAYSHFELPAPNDNPYGFYDILTTKSPVLVTQGGTGATTPAQARANLEITPANIGAVAKTGDTMTGPLTLNNVDLIQTNGYLVGSANDGINHAIKLGHVNDNVMQFIEYSGNFEFYYTNPSSGNYTKIFHLTTDSNPSPKPLGINNGGTGATDAPGARANLGALGSFATDDITFGGSATNFYQNLGAKINAMSDWESQIFKVTADVTSEPFNQYHTYSGIITRYNSNTCAGILTDQVAMSIAIGCNGGTWSARPI